MGRLCVAFGITPRELLLVRLYLGHEKRPGSDRTDLSRALENRDQNEAWLELGDREVRRATATRL